MIFSLWERSLPFSCRKDKGALQIVKMLYDFMFKEVMNPETAPEVLEDFLSCLLGQKKEYEQQIAELKKQLARESV